MKTLLRISMQQYQDYEAVIEIESGKLKENFRKEL